MDHHELALKLDEMQKRIEALEGVVDAGKDIARRSYPTEFYLECFTFYADGEAFFLNGQGFDFAAAEALIEWLQMWMEEK